MMNRKIFFFILTAILIVNVSAEKKPLDHSVYDTWESIAQVAVSNDGLYTFLSWRRRIATVRFILQI